MLQQENEFVFNLEKESKYQNLILATALDII